MPITLAEARKNVTDDLDGMIIDEFRKSSYLLDNLTFHDCVSPTGGGSTLTYAYYRMLSLPTANFRKVNAEYVEGPPATKKKCSVDLKVFGSTFSIDRIVADMGGYFDEVSFQMDASIKAIKALAHDKIINGNSSVNSDEFDGLDVAVTGSSTEFNAGGNAIKLVTSDDVTANATKFCDMMDEWLLDMNNPSCLLMNAKMLAKMRAVARRVGMYQMRQDEFGKQIEYYGDLPLIDLGDKPGATIPSVSSSNSVVGIDESGNTSIYAVRFGMDGFHGVSVAGKQVIEKWLPKWDEAGAIKKGEIEMVMALALKETKSAGVFRNIQVK